MKSARENMRESAAFKASKPAEEKNSSRKSVVFQNKKEYASQTRKETLHQTVANVQAKTIQIIS